MQNLVYSTLIGSVLAFAMVLGHFCEHTYNHIDDINCLASLVA